MKQVSSARRMRVFWFTGVVCLGVLGAGTVHFASASDATPGMQSAAADMARFQSLDAEAESVLNEVTALGAEMAVLEEERELSPKTQLMVLVSVDPSPFFQLEAIQLQIDEHAATYHQYTEPELEALQKGGSHRLFWDNVPAGRHQLTVSMMGRVPKDPDFQREASLVIISGVGRRVVELQVASGKSQPFPEIALKEWK